MKSRATSKTSMVVMAAVLGVALAGCGGLRLTLLQAAHNRPSNVAMYFTVETSGREPVGGLQPTDFRVYEDGELVSIDESRQTILNPQVAAEHHTLILVDMSGSVTESPDVPAIASAVSQFSEQVQEFQTVGIYAFDGSEELHPIQPFARGRWGGGKGGARLEGFRSRDPSTNLHGAVVKAIDELNAALNAGQAPLRFGTLVVFTDGSDRAARVSWDHMEDALDETDYDVFAIGVGNEIDEDILDGIGRDGHVRVRDATAVQGAFAQVGERIIAFTKRFYLLSYCSPARAGKHEVTIEAVTEEGSGEVSYDFNASGFGPDCDPNRPPPFDTTGRRPLRRTRASP